MYHSSLIYSMSIIQVVKMVSFVFLLPLLVLNGVESNCNYFQNLEAGRTYYAFNNEYPYLYESENHCIWQTQSPYVTKINCSAEIPSSSSCTKDTISIQFAEPRDVHRYCGFGTFIHEGKNATIQLDSQSDSEGGRFLCEIRAEKGIDSCPCGWKNPDRIVGGNETGVNEYPMMAGLVDVNKKLLYCGATIISTQHIITAAHCVKDKDINWIRVIVGEHDVSTGSETTATKLYRIIKCTVHPQYSDPYYNDIAICKINGTIKYNTKVGPVCLPFQHNEDSFGGAIVTALGWGLESFGGSKPTALQKVDLNVLTLIKCKDSYSNVTKKNVCTYTPGKDTCQMDSGGPMLWQNPTTKSLVLVGITSSGVGCASTEPAVGTHIGAFIDWIVSVTPGTEYCEVE